MDFIPYGYCQCGCGRKVGLAKFDRPSLGHKKGEPLTYLNGHAQRVRLEDNKVDRFLAKVDQSEGPDACWPWQGGCFPFGHGNFEGKGRAGAVAHRFAYELWNGPIPEGMFVLHECDNPPCCNPKHLHLGTHADNMREMAERGRAKKTADKPVETINTQLSLAIEIETPPKLIPYGCCACGCGRKTSIIERDVPWQGYKKGDPRKWMRGHANTERDYGTVKDRFNAKVDRSGGPEACWPWTASRGVNGYGRFNNEKGHIFAHRQAYTFAYGPIPDGLFVLHSCDNPPCCNPAHLRLGTTTDNMRERCAKGHGPTKEKNGWITHPQNMARGEKHHGCKLRAEDIPLIKQEVASGISQRSLARRYGVSTYGIWAVIHGKSWKHVV